MQLLLISAYSFTQYIYGIYLGLNGELGNLIYILAIR